MTDIALRNLSVVMLLDIGKIYSSYVLTNIGFAVENKKDFFADLYVLEKYKLRFIYVLGGNNMDFTRKKQFPKGKKQQERLSVHFHRRYSGLNPEQDFATACAMMCLGQ